MSPPKVVVLAQFFPPPANLNSFEHSKDEQGERGAMHKGGKLIKAQLKGSTAARVIREVGGRNEKMWLHTSPATSTPASITPSSPPPPCVAVWSILKTTRSSSKWPR